MKQEHDEHLNDIAVIGMSASFPGASTVDEYWHNLRDGVESITFFSDEDLLAAGVSSAVLQDPNYVKAAPKLEGIELFDPAFFGFTPREAEFMDPQLRLMLKCAWAVLETAGYDPEQYKGAVGVFAGCAGSSYLTENLMSHPNLPHARGTVLSSLLLWNERDSLSTLVSYKLNLTGPSFTVQTFCSTSLVAVHLACQSLLSGECDMALAGGVNILVPQTRGYFYEAGMILSPDGHCRAFDAKAEGTVFGSGVGLVLLKRLTDAISDGDCIHAVIKGSAVNNDGSQKAGYTAPSVIRQSKVVTEALAVAGVKAESISFVEAHGTGTAIGDPIEIEALSRAFQQFTNRKQFCPIGSVKANIGHLDRAAGIASLIKAILALKHREIPRSLHYEKPNPKIQFERTPFYVNTSLMQWTGHGSPMRAGVSSLGFGGTNAHVVLEEAPDPEPSGESRTHKLLLFSGKTPQALETITTNLTTYLREHPDANPADVAYTLQVGRRPFSHSRILVCRDVQDAITALESNDTTRIFTRTLKHRDPPVVFMFPGQGSQYVNMGAALYRTENVFREHVDRCADLLQPHLGMDIRRIVYPADDEIAKAEENLIQTRFTQPAIFVIEYALAKLWMSWGVKPAAMIGHSVGEYVAACIAGVFTLEEGLELVAHRARLAQAEPVGSMLAIRLPESEVIPLLFGRLSIAAINSPSLCVVAGPFDSIETLERQLEQKAITSRRLHTSHAFHSPMMDPVVEPFKEAIRQVQLKGPSIPYVSNVTGRWVTPEETTSPVYWADHIRQAVRFADGVAELSKDPRRILLEVGPGQTLAALARQCLVAKTLSQAVYSSMSGSNDSSSDESSMLGSLGKLWLSGVTVDWGSFYAHEKRRRVTLPTYPFESQRCWIEAAPRDFIAGVQSPKAPLGLISDEKIIKENQMPAPLPPDRKTTILAELKIVLGELSGIDPSNVDSSVSFLELGLDSLFLTQASQKFSKTFGVKVTIRQLLEELYTLDLVAAFLADKATIELKQNASAQESVGSPSQVPQTQLARLPEGISAIERIVREQLQVMNKQLEALGNASAEKTFAPSDGAIASLPETKALAAVDTGNPREKSGQEASDRFSTVSKGPALDLTRQQREHLDALIARYTKRTRESKRQTQLYRKNLADHRSVMGFRQLRKEMVYPIVSNRSAGSKLWDVDGNEYVDFIMGFGTNLFGHMPPFVKQAIQEQLDCGVEVGPQTPWAGKVAGLISEFTGAERVCFCITGSEAVMGAMRLARAATGRDKIVTFTNDYHGNFDEVLVRPGPERDPLRTSPVTLGIPAGSVSNLLVLECGSPKSVDVLRTLAPDLAAVLIEPIHFRSSERWPKELLQEIRTITEQSGTALIFDEIITGFRVHPGGAQALFGLRADLATYGKILGGGLPIGIIAGKSKYMDGLDGGFWSYGDASIPEVGITFFDGTFARHPLAMAAAHAVLEHLKKSGPELQQRLNEKTTRLVETLNSVSKEMGVPLHFIHFASIFYLHIPAELPFGSLLFYLLREKGIHAWEHRSWILSTAHTDADLGLLVNAFRDSLREMREAGFLSEGSIVSDPRLQRVPSADQHDHGQLQAKMGYSLSDFPDSGLSQKQLDELISEIN